MIDADVPIPSDDEQAAAEAYCAAEAAGAADTGERPPPPCRSLEIRLDLLRGDVRVHLAVLSVLIDAAVLYADMRDDDRLIGAMIDARDRLRVALVGTEALRRQWQEADAAGEAAEAWRNGR